MANLEEERSDRREADPLVHVCVCVHLLFSVQLEARAPYTTTSYRACLVFVHTDYMQNLMRGHPKAKKKEKRKQSLGGVPRKVGRD